MRRPNVWGFSSPTPEKKDSSNNIQLHGSQSVHDDNDQNDDEDDEFDSDQEMPHRRRSRSYGDAEDILCNTGYYESFSMDEEEWSETKVSTLPAPGDDIRTMTKGLHHRPNASGIHNRRYHQGGPQTPRQNVEYELYRTPTPKRKPVHPGVGYPHTLNSSPYHWRRSSLLKSCLALGFGSYLLLLFKSSVWLLKSGESGSSGGVAGGKGNHRISAAGKVDETTGPDWIQDWTVSRFGASSTSSWSQDLAAMRRTSRMEMEQRALQRRERTRPKRQFFPGSGNNNNNSYAYYSIQRMDHRSPAPPTPQQLQRRPTALASIDQLCGDAAQSASLAEPHHYPYQTALNGNSARVLITGILNPVGFSLAMYLHHRCGVQVIGGLDAMYPNTVENRLQLVNDQLALLHTTIPKLVKPIGLSFVGLEPKSGKDKTTATKDEEYDFLAWKPTHIVHLASYSLDVFSDAAVDPTWRNPNSPYISDNGKSASSSPLFPIRSSMVAMEQLLQQLAQAPPGERPHFLYASTAPTAHSAASVSSSRLQEACKLIDELLARFYSVPSVAIRLPSTIYGPWDHAGSIIHDLMESAARNWSPHHATSKKSLLTQNMSSAMASSVAMLHVDDAVETIVAAMQYQPSESIAVDLTSAATTVTIKEVATFLQNMVPAADTNSIKSNRSAIVEAPRQLLGASKTLPQQNLWQWQPRVELLQGLVQTMAWHLHRHSPYGPAHVETADEFLKRHGQPTCEASDWQCHKGKQYLPCLSECNTKENCIPSVFDEISQLVLNVTEGCNIVLYTQSLGYNVEDLELHAEFMDDADLPADKKLICNFAFVPRESHLVASVIAKVPAEQLAKFGIKPKVTDSGKDMMERKLDGLNGRLLYRGWILLWVRGATEELSVTDKSLLKLSPGKLFAPDVGRAVFMEENFSVSPNLDDVSFLVGELNRKPFPKRTLKKDIHTKGQLGKEIVQRKKFRLPPEPRRRAAILFAPLRIPNDPDDLTVKRYKYGDRVMTVHDAAKFMVHELGTDVADKEATRRQREFYEKVPSYINRNNELRSPQEPWYRFSIHHWVRTRWVVHDTHLGESRLLRCDWYQEHLGWGTELDQLSFAQVMAVRELKRRIAHNEPDDHVKTFIEQHPHLKDLTDSYEWYPMETDANQLYREPVQWTSSLPDHVTAEDDLSVEEEMEKEDSKEPVPLYVRIMSERVMAASRKVWARARKHRKKKHK